MNSHTLHLVEKQTTSLNMQAALIIFNADSHLAQATAPYIDLTCESINWEKVFKLSLGPDRKCAVQWAFALWSNEMPFGNCFEGALSMSPYFKVAVLEAMCLRWGLRA